MSIRKALHAVSSLGLLGVFMIGAALAAQEPPSKVDVFTGYAWLYPGGRLLGARIPNIPTGAAVARRIFSIVTSAWAWMRALISVATPTSIPCRQGQSFAGRANTLLPSSMPWLGRTK